MCTLVGTKHSAGASAEVNEEEDEEGEEVDVEEVAAEDEDDGCSTTNVERNKIVALIRRERVERRSVGCSSSESAPPSATESLDPGSPPASLHHFRAGHPRKKRSRDESSDSDSAGLSCGVEVAVGSAAPTPLHDRLTRATAATFVSEDEGGWPRAPKGPRLLMGLASEEPDAAEPSWAATAAPATNASSSAEQVPRTSDPSAAEPPLRPFSSAACPPHVSVEMWRAMHWRERRRALLPSPALQDFGPGTDSVDEMPSQSSIAASAIIAPTLPQGLFLANPLSSPSSSRSLAAVQESNSCGAAESASRASIAGSAPVAASGLNSRMFGSPDGRSHDSRLLAAASAVATPVSLLEVAGASSDHACTPPESNETVTSSSGRRRVSALEQLRLEAADAQARYAHALEKSVRVAQQKLAGTEAAASEAGRAAAAAHQGVEDAARRSGAADAAEACAEKVARDAVQRSKAASVAATEARQAAAAARQRHDAACTAVSETSLAMGAATQALARLLAQV